MMRWTDEETGHDIVDIVLSLNEHVKRRYEQEIVTASYSDTTASLRDLDHIASTVEKVKTRLHVVKGHPGAYLRSMVNGMEMFTRYLQEDDIPYENLIRTIQEVPTTLISEQKAEWLGERLEQQLSNFGYKGTLRNKLDDWLREYRIAPEQVVPIAAKFLDRSKTGTLQRVIRLPDDDGIASVNSIRGVFWSGYSKYVGNHKGTLTFNLDRPWSEPVFAQILTHEGYPGHQAFYCRWDDRFQQGLWPLEASYYLIDSPTNALFEGGPETALHFLGWDDQTADTPEVSKEEKQQFRAARDYLDLQRIGMTNACTYVNTGQMSKAQAIAYMGKVGYLHDVEAGLAYRFFTDPIQRIYYPSYYYGRWMVGRAYDSVTPAQRQQYFHALYDTPHTTSTFIAAVAEIIGRPFDPFNETEWV